MKVGIAVIAAAMMVATGSVAAAAEPGRGPANQVVTLITGDRVTLVGGDTRRPVLTPGEGRRGIKFSSRRVSGRLSVVPSDVAPLVASGRLDRRLFDITGLIEAGFDDSQSRSLPLIVTYAGTAGAESVRAGGAEVVQELPAVNGAAVRITKGREFSFMSGERLATGVERVWLDGKRRVSLDESVPQIGAPAAWQAGFTGKDVTVAVLDTGVDATHPDLDDRVAEARNFTEEPDGDQVGHGTHVASTIAGTDEKYRGVAPEAMILDGKVCEEGGCPESAIIAGMQWAAAEKRADVINMSLGGPDFPEVDPIEEAVNTLTTQTGSLFVIAAGNNGGDEKTISSPGSADAALTVGAVDKSDAIAGFSSRGPRVGDGAVKPDITAPGVDIVAAKSKDGQIGDPVGDRHMRASGTSMATPHVAGAAAVLAQQHPEWTAPELKTALMASAKAHQEQTVFDQGAGRVDVARAIKQTVVADPGSVSFGTARWPHTDDEPVSRQVVYRNHGTAAVTLALQATITAPDGNSAPTGALGVDRSSVTVPAGGTATVTVTSNTRHDGPDGIYSGRLVATGPSDVSVTTPLGIDKEVESYDVTLRYIGPDGGPAPYALTHLDDVDRPARTYTAHDPNSSTVRLRLPAGRYHLSSYIGVPRGDREDATYHLVQPLLTLNRDTLMVVDARVAKPLRTTVPKSDVRPSTIDVGYDRFLKHTWITFHLLAHDFDDVYTAALGEPVGDDELIAHLTSQWGVIGPAGDFANTPHTYGLLNMKRGHYFDGFSRAVKDSELARLEVRYNAQSDKWRGQTTMFPKTPGGVFGTMFVADLPWRTTHYLESGVEWSRGAGEFVIEDGWPRNVTMLSADHRTYQAGRTYADRWNAAVFGPSFRHGESVRRRGDTFLAVVPLFSDQDGHEGYSLGQTASARLFRDGQLVAENNDAAYLDEVALPAERSGYRLELSVTRPNVSDLSTRIDASWTFGSQAGDTSLPLWAVRYLPTVDSRNAVKRQPVSLLPVKLEPQPGSTVGRIRSVTIEVSGDDGKTWTNAAIRRTGDNRYVAAFASPKTARHVSLRAKATDSDGNSTQQTIIRAYAVR